MSEVHVMWEDAAQDARLVCESKGKNHTFTFEARGKVFGEWKTTADSFDPDMSREKALQGMIEGIKRHAARCAVTIPESFGR